MTLIMEIKVQLLYYKRLQNKKLLRKLKVIVREINGWIDSNKKEIKLRQEKSKNLPTKKNNKTFSYFKF